MYPQRLFCLPKSHTHHNYMDIVIHSFTLFSLSFSSMIPLPLLFLTVCLLKGRCCGLVPFLAVLTLVVLVIIILGLLNYLDIVQIIDFGRKQYENLKNSPITTKFIPIVTRYSKAFIDATSDIFKQ